MSLHGVGLLLHLCGVRGQRIGPGHEGDAVGLGQSIVLAVCLGNRVVGVGLALQDDEVRGAAPVDGGAAVEDAPLDVGDTGAGFHRDGARGVDGGVAGSRGQGGLSAVGERLLRDWSGAAVQRSGDRIDLVIGQGCVVGVAFGVGGHVVPHPELGGGEVFPGLDLPAFGVDVRLFGVVEVLLLRGDVGLCPGPFRGGLGGLPQSGAKPVDGLAGVLGVRIGCSNA
ncbi:hypothetical protein HJ581_0001170 (plasmid) [Rhodococcus opacus]|nr:hypothetical protein HJ581_0001170 [Rhodococcus opacus]